MSDCSSDCAVQVHRPKNIKKKTRNRLILLQNLNKGKARKEPRCGFQTIPYPLKFFCPMIHYLCADVPLMEQHDSLVLGASLYNNFKAYKSAQVVSYPSQKVIKIKVENKEIGIQRPDWRLIAEKLEHSDSKEIRDFSDCVRGYGQRYDTVMKEFQKDQEGMSNERYQALNEANQRTEQIRQNIFKTHPFIEFKSQLKDGRIQLTEVSVSEKYLAELGHSFDSFGTTVLQEGIPEMTSLNSQGATIIAKRRLERYLAADLNGYQSPDFESCVIMKNGCAKKIKMRTHYNVYYENGVPGFINIGMIVAKQKPFVPDIDHSKEAQLNKEFVDLMSKKEKDTNNFLSLYYNQTVDEKYTNMDKICRVKNIEVSEEM